MPAWFNKTKKEMTDFFDEYPLLRDALIGLGVGALAVAAVASTIATLGAAAPAWGISFGSVFALTGSSIAITSAITGGFPFLTSMVASLTGLVTRKLSNKHAIEIHTDVLDNRKVTLDGEESTMTDLMERLCQNNEEKADFVSPECHNGKYVTSETTVNGKIDPAIFLETQLKRACRGLAGNPGLLGQFINWLLVDTLKMKLKYFDLDENQTPDKLYKDGQEHQIEARVDDGFKVHNLNHAMQLIQTSGFNILTDPVFGDLAPVVYPNTTKDFPKNKKPEDLPFIDAIVISHNHRDHVDEPSLKALINKHQTNNIPLPRLFVPKGDEALFRKIGFTNVTEVEWHEEFTLTSNTGKEITLCSAPADHRSGRIGLDAHHSLVTGWIISPKDRDEVLYFAGDTARLNDTRMKALAANIYQLHQNKNNNSENQLPRIIDMVPGGPNYARPNMEPTHQSCVDSIASAFRLAIALEEVSYQADNHTWAENWLEQTAAIFMHQNKYELGPDRYNENIYIYNRLLSYLAMSDDKLEQHRRKQAGKNENWSLFHRHKGFILNSVAELKQLAAQIWPDDSKHQQRDNIVEFIKARVHFPLINEKLSTDDIMLDYGQETAIKPDVKVTDKTTGNEKQKGAKL